MKLTQKQKNAIENLITLAGYVKDQSIYSDDTEKIIDTSIETAAKLIGLSLDNQEVQDISSDYLVQQVTKKFKP